MNNSVVIYEVLSGKETPLKQGTVVRFKFGQRASLDVHYIQDRAGGIEVRAREGTLRILPKISNSIVIQINED